jgi:hypothetical protein
LRWICGVIKHSVLSIHKKTPIYKEFFMNNSLLFNRPVITK